MQRDKRESIYKDPEVESITAYWQKDCQHDLDRKAEGELV